MNLPVAAYCPPSSRWESKLRSKSKLRAGVSTGYSTLVILTGRRGGEANLSQLSWTGLEWGKQ